MKRRTVVLALGGGLAAQTASGQAQDALRVRQVGILTNLDQEDPETRARLNAFETRLGELGWSQGRNLKFHYRWGVADTDSHRRNSADMVALNPDVILAHGSTIMRPLQRATRKIPIVFVSVSDPVAGGFAASLAQPGGNATGFTSFDYGQSGKWLELLKELAPDLSRVVVIRDPEQVSGGGQLGAIQAVASALRVEFTPIGARDMDEIERTVLAFAKRPNGGLIVTTAAWAQIHRHELTALAAKCKLPAVYPYRIFVTAGGLCSYAPKIVEQYREAANYVDQILKGTKPSELPIQTPSRYELVINQKTANNLGVSVPTTLLARADEVIE